MKSKQERVMELVSYGGGVPREEDWHWVNVPGRPINPTREWVNIEYKTILVRRVKDHELSRTAPPGERVAALQTNDLEVIHWTGKRWKRFSAEMTKLIELAMFPHV